MKIPSLSILCAVLITCEAFIADDVSAKEQVQLSDAAVRDYYTEMAAENPDKADKQHLYQQLLTLYHGKRQATYPADVVEAVANPPTKDRMNRQFTIKERRGNERKRTLGTKPLGAKSRKEVQDLFATIRTLHPEKGDLMADLDDKVGDCLWYKPKEWRDVEQFGAKSATTKVIVGETHTKLLEASIEANNGWKTPLIRHDWSDVLSSEDPSQQSPDSKAKTPQKTGDLVGATFSYSYDGNTHTDTWSAIGAVILPWQWTWAANHDWAFERFVFAPSVSVDRVVTTGMATEPADTLLYRLGLYVELHGVQGWLDQLEFRGAFVEATDTEHHASLPGGELDIEPRMSWPGESFANSYLKIGFRNVLLPKISENPKGGDDSLLDYQLRVWLHTEDGDEQHGAAGWNQTGSFFRVGPKAQLRLNMPQLYKGFSITALYAYLPTISGNGGHESYFDISGALTIYQDTGLGHKVSLIAEYMNGGLDLTKQDVNTFTIGLGVLF